MAETHSLTWPAQQWKQFLHDYILTVDGAFERANAQVSVWFTHLYETAIRFRSFSRSMFGFALVHVCFPVACPENVFNVRRKCMIIFER